MSSPMPPVMKCGNCGELYTSSFMDPFCPKCSRKKCTCGHQFKDHGYYIDNGTNKKGSRFVCHKDNCAGWNLCDIGLNK